MIGFFHQKTTMKEGAVPRSCNKPKLNLSAEQKEKLLKLSLSRSAPLREVQRAKTILMYTDNQNIKTIANNLNITRPTVYKCIGKAITMGADAALKDIYHRPREPVITEEAKNWVIHLACTKPKDNNYAAEIWSRKLLAKHVKEYAVANGHPCLSRASKSTIHRILSAHPIRPHKVAYYCERRDPEFGQKMQQVLMVYKEVALYHEKSDQSPSIVTVSVDEKPGIQALANVADDLIPDPEKNSRILRDHEYKRLGTVSILAALDLHDGHVIAQVHDRHRSKEFISLLEELDNYYPKQCQIRIILDNHSAHISKETRGYLSTKPNRFVYVHTPKHGSWLNLVETLFGKMARTFLKHIRVASVQEIKERIILGIKEMNANPVIHRWKKFDFAVEY
jgi:transposase